MVARSIFYFLLAGLCEIGGGYLVWLWLREEKPAQYRIFRSYHSNSIWRNSDLAASELWACVCGLWRCFYSIIYFMGME